MKTTLDRASIPIPGKSVVLQFRYPSIRETRRIESDFAKDADIPAYTAAINSILTGWTGTDATYSGNVEDVLSEVDTLFLHNSLLSDLSMQEIEMKKVFLSGASKQGNSRTPNESTQPTPSPSPAPTAGAADAAVASKGNG